MMDSATNNTGESCKTQTQNTLAQEVTSQLKPENDQSTALNTMRKRPFQGLFADFDASPNKVSRKDKGYGYLASSDIEIMKKGRERLREYRRYLQKRLEAPRYDPQLADTLETREEVIAGLMLRIGELEGTCKTNDETVIAETKTDAKLTPTQKLMDIITRLQEENHQLKAEVAGMKSEREAKENQKDFDVLERPGDIFHFRGKKYHLPDQNNAELSNLKHIVEEQEKGIQLLKEEKDKLSQCLSEAKAARVIEERSLRQKNNELWEKLAEADIECMNKEIQFTEHLANTPSMIIIESKPSREFSNESMEIVEEKLKGVISSYVALKKYALHVPMLFQSVIEDTVSKVQEAIRSTDDKNKELVGKYTHEIQLRKQYHNQLVELKGNIRVYCRVRPCLAEDGLTEPVVSFDPFDDGVVLVNCKGKSHKFHMDKVFDMNVSQSQVFDEVSALVRSAIDGFNVCIFAYGQTGSGKTHTMEGVPNDPGVNQRALRLLYEETETSGWQYSIETSMLEIYNESLRDLLNPDPTTNKLEVKMKQEGGFHVPGLVTIPVNSLYEVNKLIETGRQNRATASTSMNERSSRSHSLLCVSVTGINVVTGNKTFGRLNLVDLAGSERVSKSQADGARLKEAQNINKSLSSLGDVINALKNKHSHVPYRNSKLTYLLQESLGGDSKTLMILQVAPGEDNVSESICTLTFGQRVRSAELGAAKKKTEATPTATRSAESTNSPVLGTPLIRTPNTLRPSPLPVKRLKQ